MAEKRKGPKRSGLYNSGDAPPSGSEFHKRIRFCDHVAMRGQHLGRSRYQMQTFVPDGALLALEEHNRLA